MILQWKNRKGIRVLFYCAAVILGLAALGVAGLMVSIIRDASERDPGPADAAIVLGAAVWRGRPSPVFAERIRHGIELKQQGRVRALIFTGGKGEDETVAESEAGRAAALEQGIAPEEIRIETRSRTTLENLEEARNIIQRQGWRRVLIVSDPLHMRRAMTMARDLGIDARPSPTPGKVYQSSQSKSVFLIRETYFYGKYLARRHLRQVTAWTRHHITCRAT